MLADSELLAERADDRVELLESGYLDAVDYDIFWHCKPACLMGFGVQKEGQLLALATVWDVGMPILEL